MKTFLSVIRRKTYRQFTSFSTTVLSAYFPVTNKDHFLKAGSASLKKLNVAFMLFLTGMILNIHGMAQTTVTISVGTTTWTCPTGVFSVNAECWAGGAAGGGATGNNSAGGGGGGGGYVKNTSIAVVPGTVYNISVAAASAGSTSTGANGNDTWFISAATLLAKGGLGGVAATSNNQTAAGGLAVTTGNVGSTAPFSYYGGAGGTGGASGASGGGGGSSAGTGSNGNAPVGLTGGVAPTGGFAGATGSTTSGNGADNTNIGGGAAGAHAGSGANKNGGSGGPGQIKLTYTALTYKSQLVSMNLGSTTWCAGETRNVTIQIKNIGTASWTDANGLDFNVGVKWNTNGSNWIDYHVRVDAQNLAPGATGTFTLPVTASNATVGPVYGTVLSAGTNNLTFDVVYEGVSAFGNNGGGTGPGNTAFTSANQTINALPTITQGANPAVCQGITGANLSYSATTGSPSFYSIDYDAAANSAGFIDVVNATLPATPIVMVVPGAVAAGTYNGTLTVTNSSTGCTSTGVAVAVTVNANSTINRSSATGTDAQTK